MKELKDYIHYYIGCRMIRSSHWEPQNEPYLLDFRALKEAVEFGDRPILRRLESIKEDDAIEFLKSAIPGAEYVTHNEYAVIWKSQGSTSDISFLFGPPLAFHYLLRQGFDLFGLIDAGLAIDANQQ